MENDEHFQAASYTGLHTRTFTITWKPSAADQINVSNLKYLIQLSSLPPLLLPQRRSINCWLPRGGNGQRRRLLSGPGVKNAGVTQFRVPRGRDIIVGFTTAEGDLSSSPCSTRDPRSPIGTTEVCIYYRLRKNTIWLAERHFSCLLRVLYFVKKL